MEKPVTGLEKWIVMSFGPVVTESGRRRPMSGTTKPRVELMPGFERVDQTKASRRSHVPGVWPFTGFCLAEEMMLP